MLGGVAPIPWRLPEVEKMLAGQRITEELAAKAGEQAVAGARAAGEERLQDSAHQEHGEADTGGTLAQKRRSGHEDTKATKNLNKG